MNTISQTGSLACFQIVLWHSGPSMHIIITNGAKIHFVYFCISVCYHNGTCFKYPTFRFGGGEWDLSLSFSRSLSNCTTLWQCPSAELFSCRNEVSYQVANTRRVHCFLKCHFDYLYIYICTRIFNLFTYFTNSPFLSYLHNYTATHISRYYVTTICRSVCLFRCCEKLLQYMKWNVHFFLHSEHKCKKPLALWT